MTRKDDFFLQKILQSLGKKAECIEKPNQRQKIISSMIKKVEIVGQNEHGECSFDIFIFGQTYSADLFFDHIILSL